MNDILSSMSELSTVSISVRLILATFMGSMVGVERANKRYAAGIRTFALVCMGSALATITGLYFSEMSANMADSARIPAQLLCGIGFLGAGTIIVTDRKQIKGLTTAAGLWVTASIGIAIGAGILWAALICLVLVLITNSGLRYMAKYVETHTRTIELHIEMEKKSLEDVLSFIKDVNGYTIEAIERRGEPPIFENDIILWVEINMGKKIKHSVILNDILELEGVHYVEEIG